MKRIGLQMFLCRRRGRSKFRSIQAFKKVLQKLSCILLLTSFKIDVVLSDTVFHHARRQPVFRVRRRALFVLYCFRKSPTGQCARQLASLAENISGGDSPGDSSKKRVLRNITGRAAVAFGEFRDGSRKKQLKDRVHVARIAKILKALQTGTRDWFQFFSGFCD